MEAAASAAEGQQIIVVGQQKSVVVVAGVFGVIRKVVYRLNNNNVGELERSTVF